MKTEAWASPEYIPALRYRLLTPLYDPLAAFFIREDTFKRALVEQADLRPGQRVLDIGCGTGTLALRVKGLQPRTEVVGLDGDSQILAQARRKAERAGADIQLDRGMSYELPYENQSFDRVFSTLMFHHLTTEAKRQTLAEIRRVLRPGGQFHLADWGAPRGPLTRAQFFLIQLLDGFETTRDNVRDMLPRLMSDAGLECAGETQSFQTILGRVALWRATV